MAKSKAPVYVGLAALTGAGYYLYSAGGDPKAAEKKFESDIHSASSSVKANLPSRSDISRGETDLKSAGAKVGAKLDSTVADAGKKFNDARAEAEKQFNSARTSAENAAHDAKGAALKKIDEFDRKVEEGSAKAKSSFFGWFGGK